MSQLELGPALTRVAASGGRVAWGRIGPRRFLALWVPATLVVTVAAVALAAPWLAPYDPAAISTARFAAPSGAHLLGTDDLGRDTLTRLLFGARLSLGVAVAGTAGIAVLGTGLGLVAGLCGRLADTLVSRVVDVLQAIPTLLLALVVVGVLGRGTGNLLLAIVLVGWTSYARVVRALTADLRERLHVEAARGFGARTWWIMRREILPGLGGTMAVLSTLDLGRILLVVSGLSFLGLGVEPPTPEWGEMLAEARSYFDQAPQLLAYPGLAITVVVLAFNLAGDALRDLLDPQSR